MRNVVYQKVDATDCVPSDIPIPEDFGDTDSDWRDICLIAFPTPGGGVLPKPLSVSTNGNCRTFVFGESVTVRTLELPSPNMLNHDWSYSPDIRIVFEANTDIGWRKICDVRYPQGCWQDGVPFSIACEEVRAK
jgi:hypothetical protein